jgi:hypothetical protein
MMMRAAYLGMMVWTCDDSDDFFPGFLPRSGVNGLFRLAGSFFQGDRWFKFVGGLYFGWGMEIMTALFCFFSEFFFLCAVSFLFSSSCFCLFVWKH